MTKMMRRIWYWFRQNRMEADLAEEMEFHEAMLAANGGTKSAMGNATLARETARAVWIWPWMESIWQDLAYGMRALWREPAFTLTALLALGSAIGVNTSLFTIFNSFALRPWTVRDPSHVVTLHYFSREGGRDFGIEEYRYLLRHARSFAGLIAMRNGDQVKLDDRALQLTYVSGNYFQVLGVEPERGRAFLESEDRVADPQAVVIISHALWQSHFAADPQIAGRKIRLDDVPFTIVGVAPAGFTGTNPLRNDLWSPLPARLVLRPNDPGVKPWLTSAEVCCIPIAGRLGPGVAREQAEAELGVLLARFGAEHHLGNQPGKAVLSGTSWIAGPRKKSEAVAGTTLLFLAVTLVLLLACANIGNLLLARAAARRREIAVRLSLGASRMRIVRQMLIESLMLSLAAAAIALPLALSTSSAVLRSIASETTLEAVLDARVLAYTIFLAVASCAGFGLAPALQSTSDKMTDALKSDVGLFRARLPLRSILLSMQVIISVILLSCASISLRALQRADSLDPGFDVRNVTAISIDLPASLYAGGRIKVLARDLIAQCDAAGDLPLCAVAQNAPLSQATYTTSFQLLPPARSPMLHIWASMVSARYFDALRIPLLEGRTFTAADYDQSILINQSAARRWWPSESAIGKSVFTNGKARQIIGVVSDTYSHDLTTSAEAMIYLPATDALGGPVVLVRDRTPASIERITAVVKQLEPRAEVRTEPLSANFDRQMQANRIGAALAGLLGLLALAIASVGVFGVFAYVVGQRTREIGIHMALGARSALILALVLASNLRVLVIGLIVGIAAAAGVAMMLAHVLPGVKALDPAAYAGVIVLFSAAVLLASALPARRAIQVDPVRALRWE